MMCAMIDCPMCVGIFIEEEGSCCGRCDVAATTPPPVTGCEAKGISVEVGTLLSVCYFFLSVAIVKPTVFRN